MISEGGSLEAYAATLARLRPLVERAGTVIPGHGGPLKRATAQRVLAEDAEYLAALTRDRAGVLPAGRRTATQRRIHERNLARIAGAQ
jgi:glyoxylase-like metal-dependent hydrolase (beta-lactamase superfamily II)